MKTEAGFLWEIGPDVQFSIHKSYTDGSALAKLTSNDDFKGSQAVRVIKYSHSYGNRKVHHLVTNLLDYEDAPAKDLASLFHMRLRMEEAIDILKTHHGVSTIALRSKTPDLVRQEFFGLLLATFILRKTVLETDWGKTVSPHDIESSNVHVMKL